MDQGERTYDPNKDFSVNSAMTLTLQLETSTKVHANLLFIGTLLVKYEPDWVKERGEKIFPRQVIYDGRTDRWTN